MADNFERLADKIRDYLDSNINDLNTDRSSNTDWISVEPLDFDIPQYPYIKIMVIDEQHSSRGIGQTSRDVDGVIRVMVFNHISNKYDVDGDSELERSNRVLGYLKSRIVDEINENQSVWKTIDCVDQVTTTTVQNQNTSKSSVIGRFIDAEVKTVTGN